MNIFSCNDAYVTEFISAKKINKLADISYIQKQYERHADADKHLYMIILSVENSIEFISNKNIKVLHKDGILLLDGRSCSSFGQAKEYNSYMLAFFAQSGLLNNTCTFYPPDIEKYIAMFRNAVSVFAKKEYGYLAMAKSILYKVIASIMADEQKEGRLQSREDKFNYIKDYISKNIDNCELSVEVLANELNISTTYLRKIFLDISGVTPLRYIKSVRINNACDILKTTDIAIKDVAARCGFREICHFCREFKKIIGCSPMTFRKSKY